MDGSTNHVAQGKAVHFPATRSQLHRHEYRCIIQRAFLNSLTHHDTTQPLRTIHSSSNHAPFIDTHLQQKSIILTPTQPPDSLHSKTLIFMSELEVSSYECVIIIIAAFSNTLMSVWVLDCYFCTEMCHAANMIMYGRWRLYDGIDTKKQVTHMTSHVQYFERGFFSSYKRH